VQRYYYPSMPSKPVGKFWGPDAFLWLVANVALRHSVDERVTRNITTCSNRQYGKNYVKENQWLQKIQHRKCLQPITAGASEILLRNLALGVGRPYLVLLQLRFRSIFKPYHLSVATFKKRRICSNLIVMPHGQTYCQLLHLLFIKAIENLRKQKITLGSYFVHDWLSSHQVHTLGSRSFCRFRNRVLYETDSWWHRHVNPSSARN